MLNILNIIKNYYLLLMIISLLVISSINCLPSEDPVYKEAISVGDEEGSQASRILTAVDKKVYFSPLIKKGRSNPVYKWDFDGDGSIDFESSNSDTTFQYTKTGTYKATLTIESDDDYEKNEYTVTIRDKMETKKEVLVELVTATWCGYCPYAKSGIEIMLDRGYEAGVTYRSTGYINPVALHVSDSYATNEIGKRAASLGYQGTPYVAVDNVRSLAVAGAGNPSELANKYQNSVNARLVRAPLFNLSMEYHYYTEGVYLFGNVTDIDDNNDLYQVYLQIVSDNIPGETVKWVLRNISLPIEHKGVKNLTKSYSAPIRLYKKWEDTLIAQIYIENATTKEVINSYSIELEEKPSDVGY